MWQAIINWLRDIFGLDKPPSPELQWLEEKAEKQKAKLKEIDDEEMSDDDINDYLNK